MRKLLLTLAVLCGTVSAWAQEAIDFSNLSTTKMYRIYNQKAGESQKAWVVNSNSRGALADYNSNSDDQLWCLSPGEGDNEGKYLLYNASTGKYLRGVQGNYGVEATSNKNDAVFYTIEAKTDDNSKVKFSCGGQSNTLFNDGNNNLFGWTNDSQEWFSLEESNKVYVTINYYEGDTQFASKNIICEANSQISLSNVPTLDFFVNQSFKSSGDIIALCGVSYDVNCTPNFPFEPATIDANGHIVGKWYKLTQGEAKIAYTYNGNGLANSGSDDDTHRVDFVNDNDNAKGFWAFVRVPGTIKFNVYNLGRPGVPMAVVKHADQSNKDNYNWGMLYMDYKDGSITDFVISKNGNFFNIQIPAEQINKNYATCGNHINGHFGFWSAGGTAPITAGGSQLAVEEVSVADLDLAISNAKTEFKNVSWGDEFPYANSSYDGTYINSFEDLDAVLEAATSVDDLNTTKQELLDNSQYYIRMYNAGRYKEHNQKWYVSGSKVIENGNENSLFVYNTLNKTLKQVSTGNFLIHGKELKGQGDEVCYSIAEDIQSASAFHFTPSTREGLTDAWSVYDEFGYMADWGNTNNVFSLGTPNDNWATWAVEIESQAVTGKFYSFKGSNGKYLTIDGANTSNTTLQTSTDKGTNTIFYLEPGSEDTKFYMVSYKNGNYVANPYRNGVGTATIPSNNGQTEIYKQEWKMTEASEKQYKLFYAGQYYMGVNGDATKGDANGEGEAYCWSLVPVKVLPVTITSAEYATFYAPCNVTLPEGLTAYYVSNIGNGYATLTEIEGNVVPANTGVLLNGTANTYNLTIGGEAAEVENKLSGTVASEYISTPSYVLSKQNEVVGFYKAMMNQQEGTSFLNNGFRAYLPAGENNARALVFSFGDDVETGIIETENGNVKTEVYDLAGRRVQNAQKGIFIVNGKKIIK